MALSVIDLNADLGEECGDDAAMLRIVTSANVACGRHAGSTATMRATVQEAVRQGVTVGAHVSYPDREHFGRRDMEMLPAALAASILEQLHALDEVSRGCGAQVRYVKAHGALYNRMASDAAVADAVFDAVGKFDAGLPVLTLPSCAAMRRGIERGIPMVGEAFADRAYEDDGSLTPRSRPDAILTDLARISDRALTLVQAGYVESRNGNRVTIPARSLCVHGDTPDAVNIARAVRQVLEQHGITLRAFA